MFHHLFCRLGVEGDPFGNCLHETVFVQVDPFWSEPISPSRVSARRLTLKQGRGAEVLMCSPRGARVNPSASILRAISSGGGSVRLRRRKTAIGFLRVCS